MSATGKPSPEGRLWSRKLRLTILLLALVGTVGCDQTTKHFARTEITQRGSVPLPGGFGELRLAENPGSFLSLGASLPDGIRLGLFTGGVGVGLIALFGYLAGNPGLGRLCFVGLALVWAGGSSNLIDRLTRHGQVTDFIFLRAGPWHTGVFNLADVLILMGIALMIYSLGKQRRRT